MEEAAKKGRVTPLASLFPVEEAQKAVRRVHETLSEKEAELDQFRGFISDNTNLINLVQKLPEGLHHNIMVPFGKAAFFPGRLIHTNEFLVLLGEGYHVERTSKQTVEILKRRGKALESQFESLKATMQDLKAEASFFGITASEAAEGLVEIREDYVEENFTERESQSGPPKEHPPSFSEADKVKVAVEDEEYSRMMSRLDELEKAELEAEYGNERHEDIENVAVSDEEYARMMSRLDELEKEELEAEFVNGRDEDNAKLSVNDEEYAHMIARLDEIEKKPETERGNERDEDEKIKADFDRSSDQTSLGKINRFSELEYQSRKLLERTKDKKSATEETLSKRDTQKDLTGQLNCTGLTVQSRPKEEMSHGKGLVQSIMKSTSLEKALVLPEVKENVQAASSSRSEVSRNSGPTNPGIAQALGKEFPTSAPRAPLQDSKPGFDSRKAFTGSIIERAHNIHTSSSQQAATSSQSTGSQPSKPVSRFKMQRR
ncbi:hypothetical protein F2P56_001972 [Juglans regia]|uniref:RNA polymerase II subunit 5-mediating protein homolog n=2 Tax=Juglans regia TaxID=51240 RepID=A0A834D905_JUGRE|nr:RNA polymerase II subunit 5-mediating protein homolog isoform X1 [Juglans regia]KAF5481308.1 hypothetical protein F2P56_001972 [Juglans regia]